MYLRGDTVEILRRIHQVNNKSYKNWQVSALNSGNSWSLKIYGVEI